MLELPKELGQINEKALSHYYLILLAAPVLFVFFQQRSSAYPFRNVLLAVSAPGGGAVDVGGHIRWLAS